MSLILFLASDDDWDWRPSGGDDFFRSKGSVGPPSPSIGAADVIVKTSLKDYTGIETVSIYFYVLNS